MRIFRLVLSEFRKFESIQLDFQQASDPETVGSIHVLVGENGCGKSTVVEAATAALSVLLHNSRDRSLEAEAFSLPNSASRRVYARGGERLQQATVGVARVRATGCILGETKHWDTLPDETLLRSRGLLESPESLRELIRSGFVNASNGGTLILPIIASFSPMRGYPVKPLHESSIPRGYRWEAFRNWASRFGRDIEWLTDWFLREFAATGRLGKPREGLSAVEWAIRECVPGCEAVSFDPDINSLTVTFDGVEQPIGNLSHGQLTIVAMVADIAIRMVLQNGFLLTGDSNGESHPPVLSKTPGVVIIDELDVHLHPRWQRRVCADLRRVFPSIQFIVTTHSPIIIGEVAPEEVIILKVDGTVKHPDRSEGMDTNSIIKLLMGADERKPEAKQQLDELDELTSAGQFDEARAKADAFEKRYHGPEPEVTRARVLIDRPERLKR